MARLLTTEQRDLLRAPSVRLSILMTFYLDEGTYRFCDNHVDMSDGTYTYIGANALAANVDIRSGKELAAEPVTIVLDGNRMAQAGIEDPGRVLSDILGYLYQQRRVDVAFGFGYPDSVEINLVIPIAALKINYARSIDENIPFEQSEAPVTAKLEIVLDSLAARYSRAVFRTRSHADQQEIDPTDDFFSFTSDAQNTERNLVWGKQSDGSLIGALFSAFRHFRGGSPGDVNF